MKGELAVQAGAAEGPALDPAHQAVGREAASVQVAGGGVVLVGGAVATDRPAGPSEPDPQGGPAR